MPNSTVAFKQQFEEFLLHNELELAWDELITVVQKANLKKCWPSSGFCRIMATSANIMKLPEKARAAVSLWDKMYKKKGLS